MCFDYVTGVGFDSVICVTGVDCAGFSGVLGLFLWYLHLCGILIHVQIHVQILIHIKSQPCELAEHCNFLKAEHQFALNFKA